jgi:uncharacterized damage-inducible protein DinB
MKALALISALYRHMEWADAAIWQTVLSHDAAAKDAALRERLHHVHAVQSAYFTIWTGAELEYKDVSAFQGSEAVARWGREQHRRIEQFLKQLTDERLDGVANLPWAERLAARFGTVHESSIAETLLQVPSHSTNHRGQVLTKLREMGAEPPTLDFIAWVWMGKPAASWPE